MLGIVFDTQSPLSDNYAKEIENIRQARRKRVIVFMLTVFGDESHDETQQRVFAVAGIMGTQEEWDALTPAWLSRTGGTPFHASDCEADREEYREISHEKNLKLYADLVKILLKTNLMGFAAVMDLMAHNDLFPDVVKNIPYHICFQRVVMWFARMGHLSVPQQRVKFTFDRNSINNASSVVLFEAMEKDPSWEHAKYLDEISFAKRLDTVGIQAADLLAREAMKYCDNFFVGLSDRPVRKPIKEFSDSHKYYFDFYSRGYFQAYKDQFEELAKESGFNVEDYRMWLLQNKLKDNLTNRHRYLLYLAITNKDAKIFPF